MLETKRSRIAAAILVTGLLLAGHALAQSDEAAGTAAGPAENVLLTVRLGRLEEGKRVDVSSYQLVVVSGGPPSKFLSGARVPIPTGTEDDDDEQGAELTAYVYQNIGFTTQVHAWVMDDGRIKLIATLEDSFIEAENDELPEIETRQLSINALLTPGKPLEVGRVEGIRERSGFVEIEAKLLR